MAKRVSPASWTTKLPCLPIGHLAGLPRAVDGRAEVVDRGAIPDECYDFYWLEDVDVYGHTTMHGPVRVRMP